MNAGDGTQVLVLCNKHSTNGAFSPAQHGRLAVHPSVRPSTLFQAAWRGRPALPLWGGVKSQIPTFPAFTFFARLPLSAEGGDKSSHGNLAPSQPQWGRGMMATIGSSKLLRQGGPEVPNRDLREKQRSQDLESRL